MLALMTSELGLNVQCTWMHFSKLYKLVHDHILIRRIIHCSQLHGSVFCSAMHTSLLVLFCALYCLHAHLWGELMPGHKNQECAA